MGTTIEMLGRRARRLSSGWSDATDPAIAGRQAVEDALAGRDASSADLVLVFADVTLDAFALIDAAIEAAAPARVVGCSGPAAFSASAGLARCVATHIPAGDLRFGVGWADLDDGDLQTATRTAVDHARDEVAHHGAYGTVLLLADERSGDQRQVVRGAYDVAGATVPLVGGVVGSADRPDDCWLAADGMVLRRGVVAVWFASTSPLGVAVDHGWRPIGRPLQVTRASDRELLELDGRPAAAAYLAERANLDPELSDLGLSGTQLPIGIPGDLGGYEVRAFVEDGPDGIHLTGHVHEQAIVRLMGARPHHLVAGAAAAVDAAVAQLARPTRGVLVFSCNLRHDLLGDDVVEELAAIDASAGGMAATGCSTHGEFAKVSGSQGLHGASVAVLAL